MTPAELSRSFRHRHGLVQADLATLLGADRTTVANIERGLSKAPWLPVKLAELERRFEADRDAVMAGLPATLRRIGARERVRKGEG